MPTPTSTPPSTATALPPSTLLHALPRSRSRPSFHYESNATNYFRGGRNTGRFCIAAQHHHHAGPPSPGSPSSRISFDELQHQQLPPPLLPPHRPRSIMSSTSTSPAEKHTRRGGPHVLRAGGSSVTANSKRAKEGSASSGNMPAPPPKAAMPGAMATPEEALEPPASATATGGASLKDKEPSAPTRSEPRKDPDYHALLRERDDQIAALTRELAVMELEFRRELDKLSAAESETATFWQAKHSTLHQQFLRADTDLRLLRAEVEARERERDELRTGWEVMRRNLQEKETEVRGLRGQIRGLKEFVSTSTRTDGQQSATDESLSEQMTRLANGLQNWVITNFRRAKLRPLDELDEAARAEASELLPMFEELVAAGSKVHLLQSLVARVMVEEVFGGYYAGMTASQEEMFKEMEELLQTFAASEEAVNQWRSTTLALIHREAETHMRDETASLIDRLTTRTLSLLDSILQHSPATNPPPSDTRLPSLRHLLTTSLSLSHQLSVQRALLNVYMPPILPHQRVLFDPETMEDVGGEDEDGLEEREISCVVFPGLVKKGDESGEGLRVYRNVIAKARVLCAPES